MKNKIRILIVIMLCFMLHGVAQENNKIGLNVGYNSFNSNLDLSSTNLPRLLSAGFTFNNFMVDFSYGFKLHDKITTNYFDYGIGYKANIKKLIIGGCINDFTITDTQIDSRQRNSQLYISGIIGISYFYENNKYNDWYIKFSKNGFGIYTTLYLN